jgi:hypothetical protein
LADEPDKPHSEHGAVVQRLAKETGITEEEARELVSLLGFSWASLLREAHLLNRKR